MSRCSENLLLFAQSAGLFWPMARFFTNEDLENRSVEQSRQKKASQAAFHIATADSEEFQEISASEVYLERTKAKEVIETREGDE